MNPFMPVSAHYPVPNLAACDKTIVINVLPGPATGL